MLFRQLLFSSIMIFDEYDMNLMSSEDIGPEQLHTIFADLLHATLYSALPSCASTIRVLAFMSIVLLPVSKLFNSSVLKLEMFKARSAAASILMSVP